jgi:hypothetical protein
MAECDFRRLDCLVYSQDLASCDFFLSGYLRKKMSMSVYEMVEELEDKIIVIIQAISKFRLIAIFKSSKSAWTNLSK